MCVVSTLCEFHCPSAKAHRAKYATLQRMYGRRKSKQDNPKDKGREVECYDACDSCLEGKECGMCGARIATAPSPSESREH